MKPIILALSLLLLASCSRYQYLPRGTVKKATLSKSSVCLQEKKPVAIPGNNFPRNGISQNLIINTYPLKSDEKESIVTVVGGKNITSIKKSEIIKNYTNPISTDNKPDKPKKYKNLGKAILLAAIATVIGIILVLSSSEVFAVDGFLLLFTGINALFALLIILLINSIADAAHRKKSNQGKDVTRKSPNPEDNKKDQKDTENAESESEKEVKPPRIKKENKPKNRIKNMFIYMLFANVVIWAVSKMKIQK